ncbi:glutamate receptor 1.2-like [Pyrus communis]|uniref:glutamate receptor 1.2-like n=1 Tax=Pyrus communis TaxID=23211 RepID=UPI0035BFE0B7
MHMEFRSKKQIAFICLSVVTLFSLLGLLFAENIVVEDVHVGVILDMGSREGQIILSCISTALSDFYQLHKNYTTRLLLRTKDSKGKPLHALSAALNLLDNIKVEAIIGAQTRIEASLLAELAEEVKVPIMSLSGPSHSPPRKYPFFVEITQDETFQAAGISALIEAFRWRDVILLYENLNYGRDIIPSLIHSLQEANVNVAYKSCISASSTNEQISEELRNIMKLRTTVFVVHMSHLLVPRFLLTVKELGMMSEAYAWIMTSTSLSFLHSSTDSSVVESMEGVLGLKSYIPASTRLHNLTSRLRRKFYTEDQNMEVGELSPDEIWAYDATWALAEAVERTRTKYSTRLLSLMDSNNITKQGLILLREILHTRFTGLGGEIQYPNGKLISSAFEIVNVIGKGERRVGFWPCYKTFHQINNRRNLLSANDLKTIIWPGGSSTFVNGSKLQLSTEIKLRVGVPLKTGFKEFVRVDHDFQTNRTYFSGFCIDVFEAAVRGLPYKVHYEFISFPNASRYWTYSDLVYQVYLQNYDAVVGDTTITANRSQYVDFTIPYTDLGVGMLIKKGKTNMWIFLKPLSGDLWIASACFFILTGLVVWVIERPVNQEFQGTPLQQIGTIFWFSFSTLVFAHREKILSNLAKFVVIIWVFVVLILTSSYTATLASMMTVKQIQLNSGNYIGYQSFTKVIENSSRFKSIRVYGTIEEYADALSRGSKHGGVSAIVDEVPYIKAFLAKYSADYSMIKTESITNGFGFVFPKGSQLAHDMSRQIEILREEGKLLEMEQTWFSKTPLTFDDSNTNGPNALNFSTFRGLFLVSGVASAFALSLFTIFSLNEKWHVLEKCKCRNLVREKLQFVRKCFSNKVSSHNGEN